jgi:hypothetical protein
VFWFKYGGWTGSMYAPQADEFAQIVRTVCGGDPVTVDKLVNKTYPADPKGYLTVAADHLNNQYRGTREIGPDGLFHDWTGRSASDFRDYVSKMSNALDDCQAIADGVRAIMSAFQSVARKAHDDARTLVQNVNDRQEALPWDVLEFTLTTVGTVAGSLGSFTAVAATTAAKDLLGNMKAAVDLAGYAVSSRAKISGLSGNDLLFSSIDAANQLRSATDSEIAKLTSMIDSVNTKLWSDELKVPKPKVVTDREFHEEDFDDGDPSTISDTSALV